MIKTIIGIIIGATAMAFYNQTDINELNEFFKTQYGWFIGFGATLTTSQMLLLIRSSYVIKRKVDYVEMITKNKQKDKIKRAKGIIGGQND